MKKIFLIVISLFIGNSLQAQETNLVDNAGEYLAKPSGQYSVSYHDFFWVEGALKNGQYLCPNHPDPYYTTKNKDDFSPNNQTDFCREVVIRVYYPIAKTDKRGLFYKPNINQYADEINSALPVDKYSTVEKQKLINELSTLKSYAIQNQEIANENNRSYPVIFFSPGMNCNLEMYENFITNLASHGYIVVGTNSLFIGNYIELDNGHIVQTIPEHLNQNDDFVKIYLPKARLISVKDVEFVYAKINEMVTEAKANQNNNIFSTFNMQKIGIFGHSLGGLLTGDIVHAHPSWFQVAATLDSGIDFKPTRPTKDVYPIPVLHQVASYSRYACAHPLERELSCPVGDPWTFNLKSDGYLVIHQIDESKENMTFSDHMNFSDYSTLQYEHAMSEVVNFVNANAPIHSLTGTANGWELTNNINTYLLSFFDSFLKQDKLESVFEHCSSISKNSKLICGPGNGV